MNKKDINRLLIVLDEKYPNPKTELYYESGYQLLIAVMLSAQTTDKKVNIVTKKLFSIYPTLLDLYQAKEEDISIIIKNIGMYKIKAKYIKEIVKELVEKYNNKVPSDRDELMKLPGVGRKITNVIMSVLFNEPSIAVDTHVKRISKRLGIADKNDNERIVEDKLMKIIDKDRWSKTHHQMVLFGRYICKAKRPNCNECNLKDICNEKDKI
jgi:endonuclease-3